MDQAWRRLGIGWTVSVTYLVVSANAVMSQGSSPERATPEEGLPTQMRQELRQNRVCHQYTEQEQTRTVVVRRHDTLCGSMS